MSTADTRPAELRFGVAGGGLMGVGIAHVLARAGARVRIFDAVPEARASLPARLAETGLDPEAAARVEVVETLDAVTPGAAWVFEAVPEDLALKRRVFAELDAAAAPDTVLASNTSVMRIGDIAAETPGRRRVVGTHWWNPAFLVALVEVVPHAETDPAVTDRTLALLHALGKTPVHVRKDVAGFIGNRLQHALWRQAFALVDAGVCGPEDVDTVIKASFGARLAVLGPMENADLVGLDLTKQIHDYVLPTLDPPSGTSARLDALVEAGDLGAKTGAGLRAWAPEEAAAVRRRLAEHLAAAAAAGRRGGDETA